MVTPCENGETMVFLGIFSYFPRRYVFCFFERWRGLSILAWTPVPALPNIMGGSWEARSCEGVGSSCNNPCFNAFYPSCLMGFGGRSVNTRSFKTQKWQLRHSFKGLEA